MFEQIKIVCVAFFTWRGQGVVREKMHFLKFRTHFCKNERKTVFVSAVFLVGKLSTAPWTRVLLLRRLCQRTLTPCWAPTTPRTTSRCAKQVRPTTPPPCVRASAVMVDCPSEALRLGAAGWMFHPSAWNAENLFTHYIN